jgi:hypothetical protein
MDRRCASSAPPTRVGGNRRRVENRLAGRVSSGAVILPAFALCSSRRGHRSRRGGPFSTGRYPGAVAAKQARLPTASPVHPGCNVRALTSDTQRDQALIAVVAPNTVQQGLPVPEGLRVGQEQCEARCRTAHRWFSHASSPYSSKCELHLSGRRDLSDPLLLRKQPTRHRLGNECAGSSELCVGLVGALNVAHPMGTADLPFRHARSPLPPWNMLRIALARWVAFGGKELASSPKGAA